MDDADQGLGGVVDLNQADAEAVWGLGEPVGDEGGVEGGGEQRHVDGEEAGPFGVVSGKILQGGFDSAEGAAVGVKIGDGAVGAFEVRAVADEDDLIGDGAEGADGAGEEGFAGFPTVQGEEGLICAHAGAAAASEDVADGRRHPVRRGSRAARMVSRRWRGSG